MYKKYVLIYVLMLIPLIPPFVANYIFLSQSGEYTSLEEIVSTQKTNENFCLYGSAVHSDFYHYKLEGYTQNKPDVVAIGSSRVMQLRHPYFSVPFYNMGGSITSVDYAEHILEEMLSVHTPKTIIVGVDFWWFMEESRKPIKTNTPPEEKQRRHLSSLFLPFTWLRTHRISLSDYFSTITKGNTKDYCAFGVRAVFEKSGFGPDGSHYYYEHFMPGPGQMASERFAESIRMIEEGTDVYAHNQTLLKDQVERFLTLMKSLEEKGITVILFAPPIPPQIASAIAARQNEYHYLEEFFAMMEEQDIPFYNFHNPENIQSNDCEFIDVAHGDQIAFARVLKAIAQENNAIRSISRMDELEYIIPDTKVLVDIENLQDTECTPIVNPLLEEYAGI